MFILFLKLGIKQKNNFLYIATCTFVEESTSLLMHFYLKEEFLINSPNSLYFYKSTFVLLRAPTTLKSEGEVTSLSGADKREVRDNSEKW
jgi:hypothetical protein